MRRLRIVLIALLLSSTAFAQKTSPSSAEQRAAREFETVRNYPPALYAFLREMPKGGDLHNHMTGAVYAENYIRWAAENNLCADRQTLNLTKPPCTKTQVEAKQAFTDPILYRDMLYSYSMLGWPQSGKTGHDHFFDTFAKFDKPEMGHYGEMFAELAQRNADGNVQYLELMLSPDEFASIGLGLKVGWQDDFGKMRTAMLDGGIRELVLQVSKNLDGWEAKKKSMLRCDAANLSARAAGCSVKMRYIFQVLRGLPREAVFAQILAAFEVASRDPRVVALNLVMPEDGYVEMNDFRLHMRMLSYLKEIYPKVHITLHAGELAPGLVPPDGLRFHIRESIDTGKAERIGHGVDVLYEDDSKGLLADMAQKKILVEICLTSNDMILGVKGKDHPLAAYMKAGVPVALATDDEGVARSEFTREWMKGVAEQGLGYLDLKKMARESLEHAFLPGQSLWEGADFSAIVKACAADHPGAKSISSNCQAFLKGSEKAAEQWKLEQKYAAFESRY